MHSELSTKNYEFSIITSSINNTSEFYTITYDKRYD